MHLASGIARSVRRAAFRAGILRDRIGGAVRRLEHFLDGEGREAFERSGVPGLAIVVRFAEGLAIERGFGRATADAPTTVDTVFQVQSLSKPISAACAMALVDRGLLALDEPIWRRLTSFRLRPDRTGGFDPDAITLRRLLSHGAGLNQTAHGVHPWGRLPTSTALLEQEKESFPALRIVERPGTAQRYSGGAYVLVEKAVEDVMGTSFPRVARDVLLRPLGMVRSDYAPSDDLLAGLATPHDENNVRMPGVRQMATASAGLFTTARDLATIWSAFLPGPSGEPAGRGVLTPASCREMLTPHTTGADGTVCGLGIYLRRKRSDLGYAHLGFAPGWSHHAAGLLDRGAVVTALSNGTRGNEVVPHLVREIRTILYDRAL